MIVMIVRDDDGIERRQGVDGHRHRMEALGAHEGKRRCAQAPNRIGEHAAAVDFQQHGGMPQPRSAQARLHPLRPGGARIEQWQSMRRHAVLAAEHEIDQARSILRLVRRARRIRIDKTAACILPGSEHALEPQPLESLARHG